MSVPLLKNYKQLHYIEAPKHPLKESIGRIVSTLKDIKSQKHIFMYLLAFFILIALWIAIFITLRRFSALDETAGNLLLPYLLWVTFAGYLNFGVFLLN